jgi:hypothetical protein
MRPKYETKLDRVHQRVVADAVVATHPGSTWHEFPTFHVVDFELLRAGAPVALLEVKRRSCASDAYPDYAIGEEKWHKMVAEGKAQGLPVFFAAHFSDRALWTPVVEGRFRAYRGGRRDRGDKRDVETMVHVPWKEFKLLRGLRGHGNLGPAK